MTQPYQCGATHGPHSGHTGSPELIAMAIKKAKRPIMIIGSDVSNLEWISDFLNKTDIPLVATASIGSKIREHNITPEQDMGLIEIVNLLRSPNWKGLRGEGQHDLAIFHGITYYLETQMLSTLKNFAPHITTVSLSPGYQPNADISFTNIIHSEEYTEQLSRLTEALTSDNFRYTYVVNPVNCTDCNDCLIACRREHGEARMLKSAKGYPIFCLHCDPSEAMCVAACPMTAIQEESGVLMINKKLCIQCGMCNIACPVGHIGYKDNRVAKCTLCMDSSLILPACMSACRDNAITIEVNME